MKKEKSLAIKHRIKTNESLNFCGIFWKCKFIHKKEDVEFPVQIKLSLHAILVGES